MTVKKEKGIRTNEFCCKCNKRGSYVNLSSHNKRTCKEHICAGMISEEILNPQEMLSSGYKIKPIKKSKEQDRKQ